MPTPLIPVGDLVVKMKIGPEWEALTAIWPTKANQRPRRAANLLSRYKAEGVDLSRIIESARQLVSDTGGRVIRLDSWLEEGSFPIRENTPEQDFLKEI